MDLFVCKKGVYTTVLDVAKEGIISPIDALGKIGKNNHVFYKIGEIAKSENDYFLSSDFRDKKYELNSDNDLESLSIEYRNNLEKDFPDEEFRLYIITEDGEVLVRIKDCVENPKKEAMKGISFKKSMEL